MALAARCPHCGALFRVVADQLKLRGGLVRCGDCRQVFDAIGSLSYVDEHALQAEAPVSGFAVPGPPISAAAAPAPAPAPAAAAAPVAAPTPVPEREAIPAPPSRRSSVPQRAAPDRRASTDLVDELAVPTLIGRPEPDDADDRAESDRSVSRIRIDPRLPPRHTGSRRERPVAHDVRLPESSESDGREADYGALAGAEPDGEIPDEGLALDEAEHDAPSFLLTPRQLHQRRVRWAMAAGSIALGALAAIQIGLASRDNLLETWPALRPALADVCRLYGCTVGWPAHAELLAIIGSELAAIPGTDVIELNAAIRSRASFIMALPAIEVTLTDNLNRTIARKVFLPVDYLASSGEASSRIDEGLGPESDLSIRLVFEARGLNATGFVVYPFYL
jgi:predicted Zn finger-like uncharacterized protein